MSWRFFREFCTNWRHTGAVLPSSRALAGRVVELAGVCRAERVLELGPGTGPFTREIAGRLKPGARYLGLEINPSFVSTLNGNFPDLRFECTAAQEYDFDQFLDEEEHFDSIVSGLPWTAFPHDLQVAILDHAMGRLRPGGRLVTFAYAGFHLLPTGQHFADLLRSRSARLERSRTVWPNLPPAFIYSAIKG
jgi:phospholipid N-methyltransferase